jgi:Pyruvate/2-oxoacid:ferredoxin oxidoreductase delta subunit
MPQPDSRGIYNASKIKRLLADIPDIPEKYGKKKKRPKQLAQIIEPNCTGCEVCIPFCPVDCIELDSAENWPNRTIPPVRIRYDECIGCVICVRVCEKLAWDAIVMRSAEEIEREEGIVIHATFPPAETDAVKPS